MWKFNFGGFGKFNGSVGQLGSRSIFVNFDAVGFETGEKGIQLFGGMFLGREHAIHFVCEQITAFLTNGDKVTDLVVFFLSHEHEGLSLKYWQNSTGSLLDAQPH